MFFDMFLSYDVLLKNVRFANFPLWEVLVYDDDLGVICFCSCNCSSMNL